MVGLDFRKTISEESLDLVVNRNRRRLLGEDVPHIYEFWILRKNGEQRLVEVSSVVIEDFEGRKYTVGQILDITSRRRNEEALKESEQRYRLLAENVSDVIWLLDIKTKTISYITPSVEMLTGYCVEEIKKLVLSDFLSKNSFQLAIGMLSNVEQYTSEGAIEPQNIEFEFIRKDGSQVWTESRLSILYDDDQKPSNILGVSRNIQERKNAEKTIKDSEEKYRTLVEQLEEGVMVLDLEGLITFTNPKLISMLKYSESEIISSSWTKFVPEEEHDKINKEHKKRMKSETSVYESTLIAKDRTIIPVIITASPLVSDHGVMTGILAVFKDITERKKAEEAMRASEEKYRMLVEKLEEGVILSNIEGYMLFVNPKFCSMLKYSENELINTHWMDIVPKEEYIKIEIHREKRIRGETSGYDTVLLAKDGTRILVNVIGTPVYSADGEMIGTLVVFNDITERKKAEEATRASEEKYRMLVETSPEIIFKQSMESKFTFVNKTFTDILGYNMEESMDMVGRDLVHPEDIELVRKSTVKIYNGKIVNNLQCRYKKKNGGYIWVSVNASPIFDAEGGVSEVLAIGQDITVRKIAEERQFRAEKALEESEARYRNIISSMTDGIVVTDIENRVMLVNRALEIILGYSSEELIGKSVVDFIDPKSIPIFNEKTQERLSGEVLADEYELTFLKKSGEKLIGRVGASAAVRDDSIEGSFAVITDITVQQELEERRSNFISMTTHELRTPLTIIKGYVDLFEKYIHKDSIDNIKKYSRPLQQINKNVYRLEKLISDVNNISKIEAGIFQLESNQIDFHNLLLEVVSSYRLILKGQLHSNINENHPPIFISGDSARLFQVLSNLIENAIQNTPEDDRKIIINQYIESDNVLIKIIDNGAGIEPQFLRVIFEPFVSVPTEFHVKGTGVGLYLAKFIVEAHGGILKVTSEGKGKGSVFSVSFPIIKIQETNNK
jgi:PAS domain S-box-containing protein